ncbi:MAG: hydrogenase expression/formation protein HypE [Scytonema sp. PMC 1069.18]|nr:hydrogenase expression/formation protein HypE [Scytonema sp. PMC 1069.18]MEC4881990.1 hydrogenase expression/formation protein HypE [Scytonema sp. PMC 1070.18]
MTINPDFNLTCPIPIQQYPTILLAHGGGGRLMHQLIEQMFIPAFGNPDRVQHDAATLHLSGNRIAFTTDSYVVRPLFFPGGDIGSLAVNGTVNDLAMAGARPLYLSLGFILEEGLPMETLWRVVQSIRQAAAIANVQIVTGDTKVVDRGKGDGMFINTSGVGLVEHNWAIAPTSVQPGDVILLNGDIGRHGIAIMAMREGLEFETTIESDCAPLADVVSELLQAGIEIHCLRDLTRGGLASTLNEIATAAGVVITIDESQVAVREDVQGACEILGLDPMYIANEGRFCAFVPAVMAEQALSIMQNYQQRIGEPPTACVMGKVENKRSHGFVTLISKIGSSRILEMLNNEQLPRIC